MNADQAMSQARTVLGYIGSALILLALVKLAGVANINIRGEAWQLAIIGMALRHI